MTTALEKIPLLNNNDSYLFAYDAENRLVITSEAIFHYEGLGRLRIRDVYLPDVEDPDTMAYAYSIEYIYGGMRVIQERDLNNNPVVSYTRGMDLSSTLEGAGGIGGLLARSEAGGSGWTNHAYYFADGNGNITYMIDGSQSMVAHYRYDPFGNETAQSGLIADANVYRFSSKEFHVASGMYYYGYRFYVPQLQRWGNRDPIGEKGFRKLVREMLRSERYISDTVNAYQFVYNDANEPIDALGLFGGWGSAGGYGVPGSDFMQQLNRGPNCAGAIADAVKIVLGNNGMDGYPTANDDDSLQHCITSCNIAKGCGKAVAWLLGWLKESNDVIHGGSAGESDKDLEDNAHGRKGPGCPTQSCEDYCRQTRNQYR